MTTTSPSQHYLNWFIALAVDQRADVAAIVGVNLPGSPLSLSQGTDQLIGEFMARIEKAATDDVLRHVALVVCLVALTEFSVIRKRENLQSWAEVASTLNQLARDTGNETFAQMAARKNFEGRQWVAACDKWKVLRAAGLSDQEIRAWSDQQI